MKIVKVVLVLLVIIFSVYGLVSKDFSYSPIPSLLLGIFIAIMGVEEFKSKGKNSLGMFFIPLSVLVIGIALLSF
ncbi:hypothetical protein [Ureibacillus sinduriensis]|uniref:DUF3953 domain-containing protein n=1 Tax=Ureibacillus sinduriensis BLB-1 = JCM 15800 TaxID=1384057 RepID=A0A0A3HV84_9BACL|nr:hypothetical protein [Ureibacillus sinduriensis]KGR76324.1 hypothetical protein CD33_07215 [Ureibacillus sinduriensis BLB-1 = JCM 15800]